MYLTHSYVFIFFSMPIFRSDFDGATMKKLNNDVAGKMS
jgi:hypothetical protein